MRILALGYTFYFFSVVCGTAEMLCYHATANLATKAAIGRMMPGSPDRQKINL